MQMQTKNGNGLCLVLDAKLQNAEKTSIWRNRGGWNQLAAEMCENKQVDC